MMIGFCGYKQSGKDTAGDYLVANYGFTKRAFATKVKECCAALLGVDIEILEEMKNNESALIVLGTHSFGGLDRSYAELTVRQFLKHMGTEVGRDILDPDLWVDLLDKQIGTRESKTVITDVRFQNEVDWIHACGGSVYCISRWDINDDTHISEQPDQLKVDAVIDNKDSLESMYTTLDRIMRDEGIHGC